MSTYVVDSGSVTGVALTDGLPWGCTVRTPTGDVTCYLTPDTAPLIATSWGKRVTVRGEVHVDTDGVAYMVTQITAVESR